VTDKALSWFIRTGLAYALCNSLQDNRDVTGAGLIGRKTLPVLYGLKVARVMNALLTCGALVFWVKLPPGPSSLSVLQVIPLIGMVFGLLAHSAYEHFFWTSSKTSYN
jgi:4-hydroxybenzoate polyprenyltransferase